MNRFEKSEAAFKRFLDNVPLEKKIRLREQVKSKNLGGISIVEYFSLIFEHIAYNLVLSNGMKVSLMPEPPDTYNINNFEGSEFCPEPFFL